MDDRFKNLPDWQQRFVIEYEELADRAGKLHAMLDKYDAGMLRAGKLHAMLDKYDAGMLGFQPQTPIGLLRAQLSVMCAYMEILEERAEFEGIDLSIMADPEE